LAYYIKYMMCRDSIYNTKKSQQIFELETRFQTENKQHKIEQLTLIKQERTRLSFILAFLLFLISAASFLFWRNVMQKKQLAEQRIIQLEQEKQLEATQAVLKGETTERTRISRELHDGLGGLLSGTKLILNNMKGNAVLTESSVNQFDHALSLLDTSITELRRVAYNMMPENLLHFGLKKTLEDFCNGLNMGIATSIRFSFFGIDSRFELDTEILTFRIAQELLNNALKHSEASEINIQLVQESKRISLTVQDNGKGFDQKEIDVNKSSGLRNIRSRVDSLGGQFYIYSEPDQGTEMTIEFALKTIQ